MTGLFLHVLNSKTQDMSVEPTGTHSPPPAIGLLRSLMLRLRTLLATVMALRAASISRARAVSVHSVV